MDGLVIVVVIVVAVVMVVSVVSVVNIDEMLALLIVVAVEKSTIVIIIQRESIACQITLGSIYTNLNILIITTCLIRRGQGRAPQLYVHDKVLSYEAKQCIALQLWSHNFL